MPASSWRHSVWKPWPLLCEVCIQELLWFLSISRTSSHFRFSFLSTFPELHDERPKRSPPRARVSVGCSPINPCQSPSVLYKSSGPSGGPLSRQECIYVPVGRQYLWRPGFADASLKYQGCEHLTSSSAGFHNKPSEVPLQVTHLGALVATSDKIQSIHIIHQLLDIGYTQLSTSSGYLVSWQPAMPPPPPPMCLFWSRPTVKELQETDQQSCQGTLNDSEVMESL